MVQGIDALKRRFVQVPQKVRAALARQLELEAAKVVAQMKMLVPVDTGALRDSIGWTWGDAPKGSLSIGKVRGRQYGKISITIYVGTRDKTLADADAFYARFQEFGTVKMAASPFFYPTWRANKTRVKSALSRAVKKAARAA
jgi:HK97 gp10 family phage protein